MGWALKRVGFAACRALRVGSLPARVPVLAFHAVDNSGVHISTAPTHFRAEMERLAERGIVGISMSQALTALQTGVIPEKRVVLTFDDGLASVGETAWPILAGMGFSATLYVSTDYVGIPASWMTGFGMPAMRTHTWEELRRLRDQGADIQSHGCKHPRLTQVSAEELHEELARSREMLQRELGQDCLHFCYPFGDHNAQVRDEVRACGYLTAVTTEPGAWVPGTDLMMVPRDCLDEINVHDEHFAKHVIMDAFLDGSFSTYVRTRNKLRAMVGMSWEPPRGE